MHVDVELIPDALKDMRRWIMWKYNKADSDKQPVHHITGEVANVDKNPAAWQEFPLVKRLLETQVDKFSGFGFCFHEDDLITGIDLDNVMDSDFDIGTHVPSVENLVPWARKVVDLFNSYTEVSPSGRGLKIWIRGVPPSTRRVLRIPEKVEVYNSSRFFTVTGRHLQGTELKVMNRQGSLAKLYEWHSQGEKRPGTEDLISAPTNISDTEVTEAIKSGPEADRFNRLWNNDIKEYQDPSTADYVFCSIIAKYTRNFDQIDRIFRQSGLIRNKWDESHRSDGATYGRMTIERAMQNASDEDAYYGRDDKGNGQRLVWRHGPNIRYAVGLGWLVWDNKRWKRDPEGLVVDRLACETVDNMHHQATRLKDESQRKELSKWARASGSNGKIKAMIERARSDMAIVEDANSLDDDPWMLNVQNGVLNLRTGKLSPHFQDYLMTRIAPVPFDPDAECPQFFSFLERIVPDPEMRSFIQRAAGYSMTGNTGEHVMFFAKGEGHNGKSVLINTIGYVLGVGEYAHPTSPDLIMVRRSSSTTDAEKAELYRKRFVSCTELAPGERLAEDRVKQLVGNDFIQGRYLYQNPFKFLPTHKIWMSGNYFPRVMGMDQGIWRRLKFMPFDVWIPPHEREKDLELRLFRQEGPGILRWMLEGCLEWQRRGDLGYPRIVQETTKEYRTDSDTVAKFLDEYCILSEGQKVMASSFQEKYSEWCRNTGEIPLDWTTVVAPTLKNKGLDNKRTKNGRVWTGVSLKPNPHGIGENGSGNGHMDTTVTMIDR